MVEVQQFLYWPVTGPECSRRLRLPDFETVGIWRWQGQPYATATFTPQEIFLVLISVRGWVDPRVIVRPEGFFFFHGATTLVGQGVLIIEDSWSHSDTPHSVGLLWTSDHSDSETSTWQHTTLTRYKHPCPRRDSNPQSHQASGRKPTP